MPTVEVDLSRQREKCGCNPTYPIPQGSNILVDPCCLFKINTYGYALYNKFILHIVLKIHVYSMIQQIMK
jgi:hypothetical protein